MLAERWHREAGTYGIGQGRMVVSEIVTVLFSKTQSKTQMCMVVFQILTWFPFHLNRPSLSVTTYFLWFCLVWGCCISSSMVLCYHLLTKVSPVTFIFIKEEEWTSFLGYVFKSTWYAIILKDLEKKNYQVTKVDYKCVFITKNVTNTGRMCYLNFFFLLLEVYVQYCPSKKWFRSFELDREYYNSCQFFCIALFVVHWTQTWKTVCT